MENGFAMTTIQRTMIFMGILITIWFYKKKWEFG